MAFHSVLGLGLRRPSPSRTTLESVSEYAIETIECVDDERVRVRGTSERHATSGSGAENNDELAWEM